MGSIKMRANYRRKALFTTVPISEISIINQVPGRKVNPIDLTSIDDCIKLANSESFLAGRNQPQHGLRFLKENVPSLDILEYPRWDEYKEALTKGYEIVGISFYTTNVSAAIDMAKMARDAGAQEIWAGNFGAATPGVTEYFDRVITGYCEAEVKLLIENEDLQYVKHPIITSPFVVRSNQKGAGYIFTSRGCPYGCDFCSTSVVARKPEHINLSEIERVLDTYREMEISYINIGDETFLQNKYTASKIIDLLHKRDFRWFCTTRADLLNGHVEELKQKGMDCVYVGIESMNNMNLKDQGKGQKVDLVIDTIKEIKKSRITMAGTYILGLLNDTVRSIKEDLERLNELSIEILIFLILTPFPELPVFSKWKEKGMILHTDWSFYDGQHLVFRHPNITCQEMVEVHDYAVCNVFSPYNYNKRRVLQRIGQLKEMRASKENVCEKGIAI